MPRWYFHVCTSQNATCTIAAPTPTGCNALSETAPEVADAGTATTTGGHNSAATAGNSILVQPRALSSAVVNSNGLYPTTVPIAAANQFGWFSNTTYNGSMAAGTWTFTWRENDSRSITGNPTVTLFAGTTRDFANLRFVQQLDFPSSVWWTATTSTGAPTATGTAFTLTNEYLFCALSCHETANISSGRTHNFHQEGSGLADTARANLLSPTFTSSGGPPPLPPGLRPPRALLSLIGR